MTSPSGQSAQTLDADSVDASQPRRCSWMFPAMALVLSVLPGVMGSFVVPAFEQVFKVYGAHLAWGTLLLMQGKNCFWLMTGMALFLFYRWLVFPSESDVPNHASTRSAARFTWLFIGVCLFEIAVLALMIHLLYLPIFKIGLG